MGHTIYPKSVYKHQQRGTYSAWCRETGASAFLVRLKTACLINKIIKNRALTDHVQVDRNQSAQRFGVNFAQIAALVRGLHMPVKEMNKNKNNIKFKGVSNLMESQATHTSIRKS